MSRTISEELKDKIDMTITWTLKGGNDPDDSGNVRQAVEELGELMKRIIDEIFKEE